MIAKMDRVEIVFMRSETSDIAPFLQDLGIMHVEDVPLALENHPGYLHRVSLEAAQQAELAQLEELSRQLKEVEPLLPAAAAHADIVAAGPGLAHEGMDAWKRKAAQWHRALRSITRRRLNIQDNIEVIRQYWQTLQAISPILAVRNIALGDNARALVLQGYGSDTLADFERRLRRELGPELTFVAEPLNKDSYVAVVVYPQGKAEAATALLKAEGILALEAPDKTIQGKSISEVLNNIQVRIAKLEQDLSVVNDELQTYARQHGGALTALSQLTTSRIARFSIVDNFAQSRMVGVVNGWVPSSEYDRLVSKLKQRFGDRVAVAKAGMADVDISRIPTLLNNSSWVKPFQRILGLFAPPTYGAFDPTTLVAISFTLFYSFILGDIAYGAILFGICAWLGKKYAYDEFISDIATIGKWMGGCAMVWGVIFMEFFGNLPEVLFHLHPLLNREEQQMQMLIIAIGLGAIHVPLSLILGIWQGLSHHDHHHAEEKLGLLLGFLALVVGVGSTMIPGGMIVAGLLFVAAFFFLIRSMGGMAVIGLLEIIGIMSNVLSYARLMALGMVGVALANLANNLLYSMNGLMFVLVAIPLAGAIHALNFGISVFSPTIHSLRLNYVEFLPKFYDPQGRNYTPFGKGVAW